MRSIVNRLSLERLPWPIFMAGGFFVVGAVGLWQTFEMPRYTNFVGHSIAPAQASSSSPLQPEPAHALLDVSLPDEALRGEEQPEIRVEAATGPAVSEVVAPRRTQSGADAGVPSEAPEDAPAAAPVAPPVEVPVFAASDPAPAGAPPSIAELPGIREIADDEAQPPALPAVTPVAAPELENEADAPGKSELAPGHNKDANGKPGKPIASDKEPHAARASSAKAR
jgi:hypothetical protein